MGNRIVLVLVLVLVLAPGCASTESRDRAAVDATVTGTASAPKGHNLYELPEMRTARMHRERGARVLTSAYNMRDLIQREQAFGIALKEFRSAEESYHDALTKSPTRFHPVIENEIAQVAHYMRQVQRDRDPPRVD